MEVQDPVPEIVISLPKRGKIRITSLDEADAVIVAASQAKTMLLAALKTLEPAAAPVPQDDEAAPGRVSAARPDQFRTHAPSCRCLDCMASRAVKKAAEQAYPDAPAPDDVYRLTPAGLAALDAPHHWEPPEVPCHEQDEDGPEVWLCTAQEGHGGPEHITYDTEGRPVRRWPVTTPADENATAVVAKAIANGTKVIVTDDEDDEDGLTEPEVLRDLLLVAGANVSPGVLTAWTPAQRREAAEWAAAEHLHASDNDMPRRKKPGHVADAQLPEASRS